MSRPWSLAWLLVALLFLAGCVVVPPWYGHHHRHGHGHPHHDGDWHR